MNFGLRLKKRREELGLSRGELGLRLGVSASSVSNYENGASFPKEEVLLRLFDALETEPNVLFADSFRAAAFTLSRGERELIDRYRELSPVGRQTALSVFGALCDYQEELRAEATLPAEPRSIPLYRSPAAAGYAAPSLERTLTTSPSTRLCPGARNLPCAFRATPWPPTLPTAAWFMSTATPLPTETWVSSAWTATCSASSITGTRWA